MAVHDYEPDTIVIEIEEPRAKRTSTRRMGGELDVQVLVDGVYHKRTPDHAMSACGAHKLHSQFYPLRHPTLTGNLCEVCFTPFERGIADAANTAEFEKVT